MARPIVNLLKKRPLIKRLQSSKMFSFQLPPRGTGLRRGTARPRRGLGRPLTDVERRIRHGAIYGQTSLRSLLATARKRVKRFI